MSAAIELGCLPARRLDAAGKPHVDLRAIVKLVPLAHTLIFAPAAGWIDGLPQYGRGATGGWLALMIYVILLGSGMFWRWRHGAWRRIRL